MFSLSKEKLFPFLVQFLFLSLLASIVFSWRAVSSIALGLILVTGLLKTASVKGNGFRLSIRSVFFLSCVLLFALTCLALFYTDNMKEGLTQVQKKSAVVLIPLSLFASQWFLNGENYQRL